MNQKAIRLSAAAVIAAAGLYLLITLLNSVRPVFSGMLFSGAGEFLYICFRGAAFYLPLYFMISGFLLAADYFNGRVFSAMLLSLIPFFTMSLLLRVLEYYPGSAAVDFFMNFFGVRGSSMLLGLLFIVELLLIFRILMSRRSGRRIKRAAHSEAGGPELPEAVTRRFEPVPLVPDDEISQSGSTEEIIELLEVDNEEAVDLEAVDEEAEDASGEVGAVAGDAETGAAAQDDDNLDFPDDIEVEEIILSNETDSDDEDFVGAAVPEEEQAVEPLDLDPASGEIDEEDLLETRPAEPAGPDEHQEEGSFPDAPLRGDEDELEDAARDVWQEVENLGLGDSPEEVRDEEPVAAEEGSDPRLALEENDPVVIMPNEVSGDEAVDEAVVEVEEIPEDEPEDDPVEVLEEAPVEVLVEEEDDPVEDISVEDDPVEVTPEAAAAVPSEAAAAVDAAYPSPEPARPVKKSRGRYSVPVKDILDSYGDSNYWIVDDETKAAAEVLRETLEEFRIAAEVTGISRGPVITMFEILPAPGVKLSKIVNLADNIALRLAASRVRIVAPIPGKHAVGIEVPNKSRAIVSFKEMIETEELRKSRMSIPVVLGKDITGGSRIIDLVQTPHLLIAGATGSGKSVCVNSLICSILYSRRPDEVKMILIDPKIVELKMYNDIPHLLTPVITEPKRAFQALQYCMCEMERRYSLLNALGVRDIKSYNRKVKESGLTVLPLPYIVIIVDEFADLMATTGKELESVISRLAAMSRAVGIHLVLATQRPSVDVITGLIKANIPSRIAFMVASKMDSRIILDNIGADKLLGKGDMLFTSAWDPNLSRIQGAFLSDEEVERITDHVKTLGEPDYIDDEIFVPEDDGSEFELENAAAGDPLMEAAINIVVEAGKASASYLQRRLKIGYNRAARLVEEMEDRGIVGPANGSKPREIIHIPDRV